MKILRNRYLWGGVCIIVAIVIAFVILPLVMEAKESTTMVLRAVKYIEAGNQITAADFESVEVGAYNLPKDVIADSEVVIGKYVKTAIYPGDFFLLGKLSDERFTSLLEHAMADGKKLITVTIAANAAGVAGHLQAGDTVAVKYYKPEITETHVVEETGETTQVVIPAEVYEPQELSRLTLFAVENAVTETIDENAAEDESVASAGDKMVAKTATLIVTDEQAKILVEAEYSAKIHIIFVSRG
ncbi:Flp pilus assembly protein CpaB [Clostridia bacterium]|nr:Flp pilus assembly protein CpaB [Clostridia bacterium]